jgi:hypothetical protein
MKQIDRIADGEVEDVSASVQPRNFPTLPRTRQAANQNMKVTLYRHTQRPMQKLLNSNKISAASIIMDVSSRCGALELCSVKLPKENETAGTDLGIVPTRPIEK